MQNRLLEAVKSPLSVIAIFSGLSEVAMTVTLLNLPFESQQLFIWFVMIFPLLLLILFFIVLYTKPAVLFSPADYQDDVNYLRSITSARGIEELTLKVEQIEDTYKTIQEYIDKVVEKTIPAQSNEIIDEEKRRLIELRFIHSLESNNLYYLLNNELNINHADIKQIIFQSDTAYQLPEIVFKVTSNESKRIRIYNTLQTFPKVITDFNYLKNVLSQGG